MASPRWICSGRLAVGIAKPELEQRLAIVIRDVLFLGLALCEVFQCVACQWEPTNRGPAALEMIGLRQLPDEPVPQIGT